MKIISIVGTRPQLIKLAPLLSAFNKYNTLYSPLFIQHLICHTGQHYDQEMSNSFINELDIPIPDYNLGISGGNHGEQTGKMLIELEKVCIEEKPDLIIVFGDTNSTMAGALVGSKLHIPIVHVESGLRSFNKTMPEEINRVVTDHISDYLFAPTQSALENLQKENLSNKSFFTGDIMVDSLTIALEKKSESRIILDKHNLKVGEYYLLTLHRPYNVDEPSNLLRLINKLEKLSKIIVFPVHPRTNKIIKNNNLSIPNNILLIKPTGYFDFVYLQSYSHKVITDSGGIQKESYILKKPCITLRSETEWIETVEAGWNLLIDPNKNNNIVDKIETFEPSSSHLPIFGVNVAMKMVEIINGIFA